MRNVIKNLRELRNRPESEQGFTLIEMIVVIILTAIVGTATTALLVNMTQTNADFLSQPTCTNQGKTAEKLCQLQQIAVGVKGSNKQMKLDYTMVPPGDVSPTLVWQVGKGDGDSVCIVGYDLSDATSKFTHDKPFVYDSVSREKATGVGCGHYDEAGNYVWDNDPTIPKPVYVQPVNAPKMKAVRNNNDWMYGSINSYTKGEALKVYVKRESGFTPDSIAVNATYTCSNNYSQTNLMTLISTGTGAYEASTYTYGGASSDVPLCNPKSVSLTAVAGSKWTLGNTYNFTY